MQEVIASWPYSCQAAVRYPNDRIVSSDCAGYGGDAIASYYLHCKVFGKLNF